MYSYVLYFEDKSLNNYFVLNIKANRISILKIKIFKMLELHESNSRKIKNINILLYIYNLQISKGHLKILVWKYINK